MSTAAGRHPVSDIDPFSREYLADPYPFHEALREAGPVVWLEKRGCWATGRHAEMSAVLADPQTWSSAAGVGLANYDTEPPWRPPSLLLEADPPAHTGRRAVLERVLSNANLRRLRGDFEAEAATLVGRLLGKGRVDAVRDLAEPYILKVFPDSVGLDPDGRENLLAYGSMVFNAFGPRNDILEESMRDLEPVRDWIASRYLRENLRPGALGRQVYEAADAGEVPAEEAHMLVRAFLSAGVDTTVNGIGNALWCFATHPEQWHKLRSNPGLARAAFEETLRFEAPFQTYFRTSARETALGGVAIGASEKLLLSVGAANRDPRRWADAHRFDIERRNIGHLGFGAGIHGCVGQMIARLETEAMLGALAARVARIEPAGPGVRRVHNTLRGFESLPVVLHAG